MDLLARPRTASTDPSVDAGRILRHRTRPWRVVEPGDDPAGRSRIRVEGTDLRQHDRDLAQPKGAVVADPGRDGLAAAASSPRSRIRTSNPAAAAARHAAIHASRSTLSRRSSSRWSAAVDSAAGGRTRIGSPSRTTPSRRTRAYIRENRRGGARIEIRPDLPRTKTCLITSHGFAGDAISSSSSSPIASCAPTGRRAISIPTVVRFSPTAPGSIACPSAWTRSIASRASRQTARCGPPWTWSWWWASPSRPSRPTWTCSTGSLGTPPAERLTWKTRPIWGVIGTASGPARSEPAR